MSFFTLFLPSILIFHIGKSHTSNQLCLVRIQCVIFLSLSNGSVKSQIIKVSGKNRIAKTIPASQTIIDFRTSIINKFAVSHFVRLCAILSDPLWLNNSGFTAKRYKVHTKSHNGFNSRIWLYKLIWMYIYILILKAYDFKIPGKNSE